MQQVYFSLSTEKSWGSLTILVSQLVHPEEQKEHHMQTREETLRYLKTMREGLLEQVDRLDKDIEHLNATITLLEKEMVSQSAPTSVLADFPIGKLRNMTQMQAVIAIAKHNGGIVRAQDAKRLMISGRVMRDTKNSTNITHNVILRSGQFERVAPGEYKLKDASDKPKDQNLFHAPVQ